MAEEDSTETLVNIYHVAWLRIAVDDFQSRYGKFKSQKLK
jgi:hypothetical protein